MTSYLRRGENHSASIFLNADFTQYSSGCVRDGGGRGGGGGRENIGIGDMIFIFKGLSGHREETMTAQNALVEH